MVGDSGERHHQRILRQAVEQIFDAGCVHPATDGKHAPVHMEPGDPVHHLAARDIDWHVLRNPFEQGLSTFHPVLPQEDGIRLEPGIGEENV